MTYATLPALFISHGSPMMAVDAGQASDAMFRLSNNLPQPNAIVVVSAHWLSDTLEISTAMRPETWHDFSGFHQSSIKFATLRQEVLRLLSGLFIFWI